MVEFEEETYSVVFSALKHPIRRKILRVLAEGPCGFADMQKLFNVSSPFLTYHLESMKELVLKSESGRYELSNAGEGAAALMRKVEETPKTLPIDTKLPRSKPILRIVQVALTLAAIGLLISGVYLVSITTFEYRYPLYVDWGVTSGITQTVGDLAFTTQIWANVPPPEALITNRTAELFVRFPSVNSTIAGMYNISIWYVSHGVGGGYTFGEEDYSGNFTSSGTNEDYIFMGLVSVPTSNGLSIDEQPRPYNINIVVLTNSTTLMTAPPLVVESTMYGNAFDGGQPYGTQAFMCLSAGILILGAVLATSMAIHVNSHFQKENLKRLK